MDGVFLVLDMHVGVWLHCWSVPQNRCWGERMSNPIYSRFFYYTRTTPRMAFDVQDNVLILDLLIALDWIGNKRGCKCCLYVCGRG